MNWLNELMGLTNFTGMHDEEYQDDEPSSQRETFRWRASRPKLQKKGAGKKPASEKVQPPERFRDSSFEYYFILSGYRKIHIPDLRKVATRDLPQDIIGVVSREESCWKALYRDPASGSTRLRVGYASAEQAMNHIIAIEKNRSSLLTFKG